MKVKFLFILLSALLILPVSATTNSKRKHKSHLHSLIIKRHTARSLIDFKIEVQDEDDTLILLFQSPLPNAEITITDKDGNIVVYEPQTTISKGKTLFIYTPNAYPYKLKITSPTMEITGEIVEEESE